MLECRARLRLPNNSEMRWIWAKKMEMRQWTEAHGRMRQGSAIYSTCGKPALCPMFSLLKCLWDNCVPFLVCSSTRVCFVQVVSCTFCSIIKICVWKIERIRFQHAGCMRESLCNGYETWILLVSPFHPSLFFVQMLCEWPASLWGILAPHAQWTGVYSDANHQKVHYRICLYFPLLFFRSLPSY